MVYGFGKNGIKVLDHAGFVLTSQVLGGRTERKNSVSFNSRYKVCSYTHSAHSTYHNSYHNMTSNSNQSVVKNLFCLQYIYTV